MNTTSSRRPGGRLRLSRRGAMAGVAVLAAMQMSTGAARAQLRVVTTTTDLAAIALEVGGDRVTVKSLALGTQDPHFVEPKPSYVLELRRADVYAQVGLELEVGWAPLLLDQARNSKIHRGGPGHLDLSTVVEVKDVPTGRVTRAEGDIHPYGNPHYWLDPHNGKRIAAAFAERFASLDPAGRVAYQAHRDRFTARLDSAIAVWENLATSVRDSPVVAYHTSWKYLLEWAGLEIVGYVEPKPGIPPGPGHLAGLIDRMKAVGARVVIMDPFYNASVPRTIATRAGAQLLELPSSVGGAPAASDYIALIDYDLRNIVDAIRD
ncbi:MAG: metal ABC transporter substrate-binding protein [Gemmatimonadetes bacterium]|nr:metal ABC transporter substrate-binding protein [Gemmatimonadota bacterium]